MLQARLACSVWLLPALAVILQTGCSDGANCVPHESINCQEGIVYWVDSCGDFEEIAERCDCGCLPDHSGCRQCDCTSHASTGCHQDDVWWFDSCGNLEELAARCAQGCSNGRCIGCEPQCEGRQCGPDGCGGSCGDCEEGLVCQTSIGTCVEDCIPACTGKECGDDGCGGSCGACSEGAVCQEGSCVCASHATRGCHEGDVWWFDSCGQPEERITECPSGCTDGQCTGCTPQCGGRECGPDPVCGLSCGTCPAGHTCSDAGQCVCQPDCGGRECGTDPVCGESCGACDEYSVCDDGNCRQICDLDPIESDTVIDIDLPVVRVSGTVTLNGQVMPDASYRRGYLVLVNKDTRDAVYASVGESGPAGYLLEIFAGRYDIEFHGYDDDYQQVVPYQEVVLQRDVEIQADRTLDFDLLTVNVAGTVSLNGGVMPDASYRRGYVVFTDKQSGDAIYAGVGEAGPAAYDLTVFRGTYDVAFHGYDDDYQQVVPYQQTRLQQDVEILSDRTLDFDLHTATLSGTVTLDGTVMPDASYRRGHLVAVDRQTGDAVYASVGETGPASYTLDVFCGRYDLYFHGYDDDYQQVVPYQRTRLQQDVEILSGQSLDFDLRTATLSGTVTLDGSVMPDASYRRGYLVLTDRTTHDAIYASVGETGPAAYTLTAFRGTYDVAFHGYDDDYQQVVPYQQTRLQDELELTSNRVLDWNLETVTVSGTISLNGAVMPDASYRRGYVVLTDRTTYDSVYASVGETGTAAYQLTVFRGTYDVAFHGYDDDYQQVVPYQQTRLQRDLALDDSQVLDWNLETVTVSGLVTRNGQQVPDASYRRGWVVLTDKHTHDKVYAGIGETGPAAYAVEVFEGRYDVDFSGYDDDYQDVLPCQTIRVRTGCLAQGTCEGTLDDVSGTWDVDFLNTSWSPDGHMTLYLVQDGESLSGSYTSPQWYIGSGQVTNGRVQNGKLTFTVRFAQTGDVLMEGALLGPCTLYGHADVSGGLDSDFVGIRR